MKDFNFERERERKPLEQYSLKNDLTKKVKIEKKIKWRNVS